MPERGPDSRKKIMYAISWAIFTRAERVDTPHQERSLSMIYSFPMPEGIYLIL